MMTSLRVALAGSILMACSAGWAQPDGQKTAIGNLDMKQIAVVEIDPSHVRVAVNLTVVPAQTATLMNMRLCAMRLNGQPVFAAPLSQEIPLKKGVLTALPPLYVTVFFRDLSTVEPLSRMIEKQSVRVEADLVADLKLNFVERLALGAQHPKVEVALSQDVPAEVGGSPLQRSLAMSILSVIDSGLKAGAMAANIVPGIKPVWIRGLETGAAANVLMVESSYTVTQGGKSYPVTQNQLGFRVASGEIVTTAEAAAPWKYDAEFMAAVHAGDAKVDKTSQRITLSPMEQNASSLSFGAREISKALRGTAEKDSVIAAGGHAQAQVLERASPDAMMVLTPGVSSPGLPLAPPAIAAQDNWDHVAVFRLKVDPATKQPSVEVLALGARRDGKAIRLTEPVDASVFGSPIVTPDGVIGIVEDEQVGAFLPAQISAPAKSMAH